jgi:hypothetical protein
MIGYNRTVKLRWLDETVDLFLAGMSDADIYEALRERLKDELSVGSTAPRGSREKTITILMKTWVRVPPQLRELRKDGVQLLHGVRRSERLPLHWGMTMAVYPFWRVVADVTGRLFRLQGTAAPMQVQRRVKELLGEREAVARSVRYVLRAFADWGVIEDSDAAEESTLRHRRLRLPIREGLPGSSKPQSFQHLRPQSTSTVWSMARPCSHSGSAESFRNN